MGWKNKDAKAVVSNIGWLLFDKIALLISNAVIVFVVANYYGASEYGIFQYANSIVLLLAIIVQLIDARVTKKKYTTNKYDYVVFNATIAKCLLSLFVLLVGGIIILIGDKQYPFSQIFLVLLIDNIVKNIKFGMENRFEYLLRSKNVIVASDISLLIGTVLQIVAVRLQQPIIVISIIQLIASVIGLVILRIQYCISFKIIRNDQKVSLHFIQSIILESLPLSIAAAASVIYTKCDAVMLGRMMSSKEVGIYSISSNLIRAVQLLIIPIQTTIYVKMLEWKSNDDQYNRKYLQITSFVTWISIIGILFSFLVLPIVFGFLKEEYLPAMSSYYILSIGSLAAYNAILRSSHVTIISAGKCLMGIQWIAVVLNLILNYFLIDAMGMNGAAVATATSQVASLMLLNILYPETRYCFLMQLKAFNPKYGIQFIQSNK